MNKEMWNQKMEEINKKIKELGASAKDALDTVKIKALYAEDSIDDAIAEAKSNINAMKESYLIFKQEASGKISSKLIEAQMNLNVAKAELEKEKNSLDKESQKLYIEGKAKYAEACAELSRLAAEEAKIALLEVEKSKKDYDDKYGA